MEKERKKNKDKPSNPVFMRVFRFVFIILYGHTSASTKLILSHGDYNSVKHAGGWANLEMLTRRYGAHSFEENRENMAQKMDDFLIGKKKATPKAAASSTDDAAEQIKTLVRDNPDLLIQILQSIQSANQ